MKENEKLTSVEIISSLDLPDSDIFLEKKFGIPANFCKLPLICKMDYKRRSRSKVKQTLNRAIPVINDLINDGAQEKKKVLR